MISVCGVCHVECSGTYVMDLAASMVMINYCNSSVYFTSIRHSAPTENHTLAHGHRVPRNRGRKEKTSKQRVRRKSNWPSGRRATMQRRHTAPARFTNNNRVSFRHVQFAICRPFFIVVWHIYSDF